MRLKDILKESPTDSPMYDINLTRLMDACTVKIDDDYYDDIRYDRSYRRYRYRY